MTFFKKKTSVDARSRSEEGSKFSFMGFKAPVIFKGRSSSASAAPALSRHSSELKFTINPASRNSIHKIDEATNPEVPVVVVPEYPIHEWVKSNCLVKDFIRTKLIRNIKASASTLWSRGLVGAEMEQKSRNIILNWVKNIDSLSKCAHIKVDDHVPNSLWSLPEWAIDSFPTQAMFMTVQSHVERHFGFKLNDPSATFSVAGILSSEAYLSSASSIRSDMNEDWQFAPPCPFPSKRQNSVEFGPSETSVRMYVCVYSGKSSGEFLKFHGSRSLKSKENPMDKNAELILECPSWYSVLSWSDHKTQIKMPTIDKEKASKEFWIIAIDASKVRRAVAFSDVDLLECEQLVRESGADFQLYLGKIEDRRKERLSRYENSKQESGQLGRSVEPRSAEDVTDLIDQGIATLVVFSPQESLKVPASQDSGDDEEDDPEFYDSKFMNAKAEKIRTRSDTGFVSSKSLPIEEDVENALNDDEDEDTDDDVDTGTGDVDTAGDVDTGTGDVNTGTGDVDTGTGDVDTGTGDVDISDALNQGNGLDAATEALHDQNTNTVS
eukprot:CAMPEP_0114343234 /NCGR_PEP_ID=MMETSP0101-20121206/10432_1 /TAXON_ID=38822 ORGANISM="Pteridomonas danica, Strain PT" /NCGR_SAMPLE_ID=MMETSP0101 /ASSEMBLY_ACC=CAM_ASM_000211 /LENGTH=551 /DNA_ID=CAMNT_0001477811 /DNA_START=13 /DNA_END=1668 /DNA_ORIENTATION=-